MSVLQVRILVRIKGKTQDFKESVLPVLRGHTPKDFWTREENKDKRPKNWRKPSKEKAVIAVESKENEKIFGYGWAFEDLETTFMDLNIWIADISGIIHNCFQRKGYYDCHRNPKKTLSKFLEGSFSNFNLLRQISPI
jgi:hypothetical protein